MKKPKKTVKKLRCDSENLEMGEAVVFDPPFVEDCDIVGHPLKRDEVVYFLCHIPNVQDHCIVAKSSGQIVPMVHPSDFRKATDEEL